MIPAHNCAKKTRRAPALLQLLWERNGVLLRNIIFVHVDHPKVPFIHEDRFETTVLEDNPNGWLVRVEMRFGFMEVPDVELGLQKLAQQSEIRLEPDHKKWNVHVVREHLAPARDMGPIRAIRFKAYEFLRLIFSADLLPLRPWLRCPAFGRDPSGALLLNRSKHLVLAQLADLDQRNPCVGAS